MSAPTALVHQVADSVPDIAGITASDHNAVLDPAEGQRKACAAIALPSMRPPWCAKYGIMTPPAPMPNPFASEHFDPMRPVCQTEINAARRSGGTISERCKPYVLQGEPTP
jgi:hypothetical protein